MNSPAPAFASGLAWFFAVPFPAFNAPAAEGMYSPGRKANRQPLIAAFTFSAVIGNERTRAPTALAMALATAGATTVVPGSPQPVG